MLRYTTTLYASSRPKTHRAHILCSTTTLYALPRDLSETVCGDGSKSYKPYSTVSVDSQGVGSGDSLCALRVGAAFDRSRYNQSERRQSFFSILT